MSRLVEDLLLLARLDEARPLERDPVDLRGVIDDAVDAARVVDSSHSYGFELGSNALLVDGDERRLRQVLDNLLTNVRQHTPPGSAVYVTARRNGGEIVLHVEDNGPGIPPELRDRIFDRFVRPDSGRNRDSGGAGLGLAIVRSIVTAHGGSVGARAVVPHGLAFELRLPARLSANSQPPLSVG